MGLNTGAGEETRQRSQNEWAALMRKARVPRHHKDVWTALLAKADWDTGVIPPSWQPHSTAQLARWAALSEATVCRALNRLEEYGWITRHRQPGGGRGRSTTYQLRAGLDYAPVRPAPMTGSQRSARWRQRKLSQNNVTELSHFHVTHDPETLSKARHNLRQNDVTIYVNDCHVIPGQDRFPAKGSREEEEVKGRSAERVLPEAGPSPNGHRELCPACGYGIDPRLTAAGITVHPACDFPKFDRWPEGSEGEWANRD